jgi:hypothetical protein
MDNKQLIKQYVDTGLALPKEQFYKLNNNQKTTYIRKRNIAVDNGSDPKSYELKYFSEDVRIKIIVTDPYYYYNYLEKAGALTDYIILECVKRKPSIIQYVNNPSEEVQLEGVKHTGYNIEYLYNPAEVAQIAAVKNSAIALSHIQNPSEEVQLAAVRSHSLALGTIFSKGITPSENVVTSAIILNPINAIYHLREYDVLISEELKMMAVNINGKSIQFMYNPSEELQLAAIKNSLYAFGNIKNPTEKARLLYSKKYPNHIKAYPLDESKGYNGMKLLEIVGELDEVKNYLSFDKAREFVRSLNLSGFDDYRKYTMSGEKPKEIPSRPDFVYKNEFKGYGDWVGTGRISNKDKGEQFLPFEQAREYVRNLNLYSFEDWKEYSKSDKKPMEIPTNPQKIYKDEWTSYSDFLGTGRLSPTAVGQNFWPFEKSREFARGLNLNSNKEYRTYTNSGDRPKELPTNPDTFYGDEFTNWGDFLGTGFISNTIISKQFLSYEEAREYVRRLNFVAKREYLVWAKSDKRPKNIPYNAQDIFKKRGSWINWYDYLVGPALLTDKEFNRKYEIKDKPKQYVSFLVARDMARDLNLNSKEEWYQYVKDNKPKGIPIKPQEFYKELWTDWNDFLNIEN